MNKQLVLNTLAKDIFRKQADFDYISARVNFRLGLRQQFLWSAQQAIEKYLKAILLFKGITLSLKNMGITLIVCLKVLLLSII
ncbi:HEPN domain-containing protein [Marinomonas fungiae]|uniref:HEPN domain n=1 Tax=Marinomonas fungiae TaxID=1137284 RepID=A0A0K6IS82_9GAMM|nr:HEPN domain-containing protein [Marinomonas fungiae]CUB05958.1 HEPN domain [Marinomonas fungiae]